MVSNSKKSSSSKSSKEKSTKTPSTTTPASKTGSGKTKTKHRPRKLVWTAPGEGKNSQIVASFRYYGSSSSFAKKHDSYFKNF